MTLNPPLPTLKVIPLGGCGEFGRNLTVYEAAGDLVAVDCGVQLAPAEAPGVELFVPDLAWLVARRDRLRAWVITHAHDDHLAALPWALSHCPAPVYGRPFTLALARRLCREAPRFGPKATVRPDLRPLDLGASPIACGALSIAPLPVAHSIPDACALVVRGAGRAVLHTGDLKLEAADDLGPLSQLRDQIDLLVGDSTNAARPGRSGSEAEVARALRRTIAEVRGRVAITLFSSNVARLGEVLAACAAAGRKVCIEGRGLRESCAAAAEVHALRPPAGLLVDAATAMRLFRDQVAFLLTGSQGERRAALARLATDDHPRLRLEEGDSVLFASRPVPGNEHRVDRVIEELLRRGIQVLDDPSLHASGHACRDELRALLQAVRPRALLPVHGRLRQLCAHAEIARDLGIPALVVRDGAVIELDDSGAQVVSAEVQTGALSVEGSAVGDVDAETLRARQRLGHAGVVLVARVGERARVVAHGVAAATMLEELVHKAERQATAALFRGDDAATIERMVARIFASARGPKPTVRALV